MESAVTKDFSERYRGIKMGFGKIRMQRAMPVVTSEIQNGMSI